MYSSYSLTAIKSQNHEWIGLARECFGPESKLIIRSKKSTKVGLHATGKTLYMRIKQFAPSTNDTMFCLLSLA
ncbi:hypothetical protein VTL71DRAFT_10890, partial [Oculimacula yallundae]